MFKSQYNKNKYKYKLDDTDYTLYIVDSCIFVLYKHVTIWQPEITHTWRGQIFYLEGLTPIKS